MNCQAETRDTAKAKKISRQNPVAACTHAKTPGPGRNRGSRAKSSYLRRQSLYREQSDRAARPTEHTHKTVSINIVCTHVSQDHPKGPQNYPRIQVTRNHLVQYRFPSKFAASLRRRLLKHFLPIFAAPQTDARNTLFTAFFPGPSIQRNDSSQCMFK